MASEPAKVEVEPATEQSKPAAEEVAPGADAEPAIVVPNSWNHVSSDLDITSCVDTVELPPTQDLNKVFCCVPSACPWCRLDCEHFDHLRLRKQYATVFGRILLNDNVIEKTILLGTLNGLVTMAEHHMTLKEMPFDKITLMLMASQAPPPPPMMPEMMQSSASPGAASSTAITRAPSCGFAKDAEAAATAEPAEEDDDGEESTKKKKKSRRTKADNEWYLHVSHDEWQEQLTSVDHRAEVELMAQPHLVKVFKGQKLGYQDVGAANKRTLLDVLRTPQRRKKNITLFTEEGERWQYDCWWYTTFKGIQRNVINGQWRQLRLVADIPEEPAQEPRAWREQRNEGWWPRDSESESWDRWDQS